MSICQMHTDLPASTTARAAWRKAGEKTNKQKKATSTTSESSEDS